MLGWPVRELLLAYVALVKSAALESYNQSCLMWALMAPHAKKPQSPPKVPGILK